MTKPYYFWLGSEAEQTQCDLETYEQLCIEAGLVEEDQPYE